MKYLVLSLFCLSLNSCFLSKPRRAERKIEKAIKLDPSRFFSDTILVHDTIVINSVVHDTIKEIIYHDTVTVINNDRVSLKYFYDTTRLEIWHEVECRGDTVYYEKELVVPQVIEKPAKTNYWILLDCLLGGLAVGAILSKRV